MFRLGTAFIAIALFQGVAFGQSTELKALLQRVEDQKKAFATRESQLRTEFLGKFAVVERRIHGLKLDPQEKSALIDEIQRDRENFDKNLQLPTSDAMLHELWMYEIKLHRARGDLVKAYRAAIDCCLRIKDDEQRRNLVKDKIKLDEELPGRSELRADTKWVGSRHAAKASDSFTLIVDKYEDNAIVGSIKMDRGKTELKVKGQLEGNYIKISQTELTKGTPRLLQFEGLILRDRILLNTAGVVMTTSSSSSSSSTPLGGIVNLRKNSK